MENLDFISLSKNLQNLETLHKNLVKNYYYGIYDRDTYYVLMKKIKGIYEELNNLKNSEIFTPSKFNIINKKILNFSMEIGCLSINEIIELNYNNLQNKLAFKNDYNDIYFFNSNLHCLSYKIYNNSSKEYTELAKNNKKVLARNDNSIRYKRSLLERLNSLELVIHIKDDDNNNLDEFLCIYGYFINNNLSSYHGNSVFFNKFTQIKNQLLNETKINKFKLNYLNIMSMKTIIIESHDKILDEINHMYNESISLKNKPNSIKVRDFLMGSLVNQKEMLNCLLCSDDDDDLLLANLLFDSISKNTEITKYNPSSDELFKALHFNLQEKLKEAFKTYENIKRKIMDDSELDIPYDKKIIMMNCNDSIKKKAFTKLKEMDGSRESSTKAQSFLDGLLKIPFGVYKKEPIFLEKEKYLSNLDNKINSIKEINNKFKNDYGNKNIHKLYICVDKLYEDYKSSSLKYDSEIEKFLKKVNETNINLTKILSNCIDNNNDSDEENTLNNEISLVRYFTKYAKNNNFKEIYECINESLSLLITSWNSFVSNKTKYLDEVDDLLDDAVYGHKQTKRELKRLIGQWINGKVEGNVIGLCGPPGVGKTSFAKRGLSKCLKDDNGKPRPFAFLPIGGATNGSFLEGHGYTYLGSTWGKIADILMESGCMNPIIFIDELDKVSNTEHGREIIGILTHITDPTQNNEYYDKFFQGIPLDLSKALFVFSYNDRSLVDRILRDRIHEINIKALTKEEKLYITKNYTLPDLYSNIGFSSDDIVWDNGVIENLIENYTYEAGIRKLNELLNEILREINLERIQTPNILPKFISKNHIEELFNEKPKLKPQMIHNVSKIGLINGLYASASGLGGLTPIEVVRSFSDSKLSLELTGSQGDVMKESMKVAKTLSWNLIPNFIKKEIKEDMETNGNFGLHIHCPDGATPKDGPSAGGAITVAIISRLCNVRIRNDLCMTGEINLQGKFTAIGGLDAKLKGGEKAGCKIAIIPKENEEDYKNIIKEYDLKLDVKIVDNIYDVLKYALVEEDVKKINLIFNEL